MTTKGYKIIIGILALIIAVQAAYIFIQRRPATVPLKEKPFKAKAVKPARKVLPEAALGKVAIVLDDWGYNLNNIPVVEQIPYPLTIAVLPNLSYSQKVGEILHDRGFEIILHCPMEPLQSVSLEKTLF